MSVTVDIYKEFREFSLDVAFSAGEERIGILGASGCGKSMTLKSVAGIERPDRGFISIDGETVFDAGKKINLPPRKRKAGYLFQNYALFPTMTVAENLRIALSTNGKIGRDGQRKKTARLLERFGIADLVNRYPSQLSGGQQQRVALARMLAPDPRAILLDEPFSALDAFLRRQVEDELSQSLTEFPGTILFVSHDRDEVFRFCERMIVLDAGKITRAGSRDEVFAEPRTVPAARLTGCKNIATANKAGEKLVDVPDWGVTLMTKDAVPDGLTHAGIRAHHIRPALPGETVNCFEFSVDHRSESPFFSTEYVTALTGENAAGGNRDGRKALYRESGDHLPLERTSRLCLPSDKILLLRP